MPPGRMRAICSANKGVRCRSSQMLTWQSTIMGQPPWTIWRVSTTGGPARMLLDLIPGGGALRPSSVLVQAPGDVEAGSRHVIGRLGGEPDHHRRHLLGVAAAPERDARSALRLERGEVAAALQLTEDLLGTLLQRRVHHARRDAVDPDAVPGEPDRGRAGQ